MDYRVRKGVCVVKVRGPMCVNRVRARLYVNIYCQGTFVHGAQELGKLERERESRVTQSANEIYRTHMCGPPFSPYTQFVRVVGT